MAVAVQCEGRDDEVVEVDARFGQHGQKALGVAGGGDALQKRGQPELEMTPDALGDLGVLQPLVVQRGLEPPERLLEIVEIRRLEQILRHMILDGHVQIFKVAVAAQNDDLDLRVVPVQPLHQFHAVHPGHPDVRKDHVRAARIQLVQHLLPVRADRTDLVAPFLPRQTAGDAVADVFLVIRDQ